MRTGANNLLPKWRRDLFSRLLIDCPNSLKIDKISLYIDLRYLVEQVRRGKLQFFVLTLGLQPRIASEPFRQAAVSPAIRMQH